MENKFKDLEERYGSLVIDRDRAFKERQDAETKFKEQEEQDIRNNA